MNVYLESEFVSPETKNLVSGWNFLILASKVLVACKWKGMKEVWFISKTNAGKTIRLDLNEWSRFIWEYQKAEKIICWNNDGVKTVDLKNQAHPFAAGEGGKCYHQKSF